MLLIEKISSIPKTYAIIGLASLYTFLVIFILSGQLLTQIAGFVIPGYYSLEALLTSGEGDIQWLIASRTRICDDCLLSNLPYTSIGLSFSAPLVLAFPHFFGPFVWL